MKNMLSLIFCVCLFCSSSAFAMSERLSYTIFNGNGITATEEQRTIALKLLNDSIDHTAANQELIRNKKEQIQNELKSPSPNRDLLVSLNDDIATLQQDLGQIEIDAQLNVRGILGLDNYKKLLENIERQKAGDKKEKQQLRENDRGPGLGGESRPEGGGFN